VGTNRSIPGNSRAARRQSAALLHQLALEELRRAAQEGERT